MTKLEQADMNLNCKSVQARLATSWGYVKTEQADQKPMKVCRHCGFLCKPNDKESKKWFPLEQTYAENNEKRSDLNTEQEPDAICDHLKQQAEQEPVGYHVTAGRRVSDGVQVVFSDDEIFYAAPVRTKDLTDDEIDEIPFNRVSDDPLLEYARAVIAADRERNR